MTAFATNLGTGSSFTRKSDIDALITANRFATAGDAGIEDRKTQRLTIQDINQLSKSSLVESISKYDIGDSRSPIMKFIDVIDLPRNTVANMVYGQATPEAMLATIGGTAALGGTIGGIVGGGVFSLPTAAIGASIGAGVGAVGLGLGYLGSMFMPEDQDSILREARMGSLGQRVLSGSDILQSMGVENRVVRAVVGFGGDVLMDPLTYLSGGGNIVYAGGKAAINNGARVTVSKVGHLKVRDMAEEVVRRGGELPTDGPLSEFNHLFATGMQIGDEIVPTTNLDDILATIRKTPPQTAAEAKALRSRLTDAITDNIIRYGRSNPLESPVHEIRGAVSRNFLRRYAASSNHQFTFPLSGFASNVLRRQLGYRTFDVPVGRFGREGTLRRALGSSEDTFVDAVRKNASDKLSELQALRADVAGGRVFTTSKVVAAGLPVSVKAQMQVSGDMAYIPIDKLSKSDRDIVQATDGVQQLSDYKFDARLLDETNKRIARYNVAERETLREQAWQRSMSARMATIRSEFDHSLAVNAKNDSAALAEPLVDHAIKQLNEASRNLNDATEEFVLLVDDATVTMIDRAMDTHNAWNRDEVVYALSGPAAMVSKLWKGNAEYLTEVNDYNRAASVHANEVAALDRHERALWRRLADIDPDFSPHSSATTVARYMQKTETRGEIARQLVEAQTVINRGPAQTYRLSIPAVDPDVWDAILMQSAKLQHTFTIKKGVGEGATNAGKKQTFDLSFEDQLDRLVYVATTKNAATYTERAIIREANDIAQLVYGVSKSTIGRYGRNLRDEVERGIAASRSPGDAGVSAGAQEVGRAYVAGSSREAVKRRKFNINTEAKDADGIQSLFEFGPIKGQTAMNLLGRMADRAVEQSVSAMNDAIKIRQMSSDLHDIAALREAAKSGFDEAMQPVRDRINELRDSNMFKIVETLEFQSRGIRNLFGIGRRNTTANIPIDTYRRRIEAQAQIDRDDLLRQYGTDIKALRKAVPHATGEDVNLALVALVSDLAEKNGRSGFIDAIDEFGNPMDVMVPRVHALRNDPQYVLPDGKHMLLDSPEVIRMARRYQDRVDEYYRMEQGLGIVPNIDPTYAYLPIRPAEKARAAWLEYRASLLERGGTAGRINPGQAFTHRRSTNFHVYDLLDDMGRPIDAEGRLIPAGMPTVKRKIYAGTLAKNNAKELARVQEFERWRKAEIRRLGETDDWLPESIPSSPYQLNLDRDSFEFAVDVPFESNPFETDVLTLLGQRTLEHHKSIASKRMLDEVILRNGRLISDDELKLYPQGIGSGTRIIDGVEMRRVNADAISRTLLKIPIDDQTWGTIVVPEPMAAAIDDFAKFYSKEENVAAIGAVLDKSLSWWKTTKLFNPSWLTTNVVSNAIMATALGGMRVKEMPHLTAKLNGVVRTIHGLNGDTILSNARKIEVGGMMLGERDLLMQAAELGIVNSGRTVHEITSLVRMGDEVGNNIKKMMSGGGNPFARVIGKWYQVNAAVDDIGRIALWVDLINQGHSMEEAARRTIRTLFDYADLTRFEDRVARRVFPFVRWMRNNVALQFKSALDQPAFAASFPKLQSALETAFLDEDAIPMDMRPRWIRDQLAVQISDNPDARFLMLGSGTPINELYEIGQGAMGQAGFVEMVKYFASQTHPLVRMPTEIAFGKVLFTGRPIKSGVAAPDYALSPLEHAGREFMPMMFLARVKDYGTKHGFQDAATRFFLGGRLSIQTPEAISTSAHFDWAATINGMRQQIKALQEAGDVESASNLANQVINRYRVLWDQGLTDLVPKFLHKQFSEELDGSERPDIVFAK